MTIKLNDKVGKLIISLTVTLLILQGMIITKGAIVTYIGKNFVTPFLANPVLVIHPQPKLTIKPSLIEFQVLKVPATKTIGVKK